MFVDEVDVLVAAGDGGRGAVSFRREKFIPRGGPDGGDGGHGGSVYLVASPHHNTLVHFRFHPEFAAPRGGHGQGSNRSGKMGGDLRLDVPVGTTAYTQRPGQGLVQVADLTEIGQEAIVARGGRGGRGNSHFVSSTNRAPRRADPGEPGEIVNLHLRLKLLADVGLIGFPNAGKSTLIARISAAKPKIADYPFTTLTPNLGVVSLSGERDFVVADVPGLIEGAHEGHGLGHRFLGHVERTKVLIHLVDVSSGSGRDPVEDFDIIQRELSLYTPDAETSAEPGRVSLADRPMIVAPNKIDALDEPDRLERVQARAKELGFEVIPISAAAGMGIDALLEAIWRHIAAAKTLETAAREAARAAGLVLDTEAEHDPGARARSGGRYAPSARAQEATRKAAESELADLAIVEAAEDEVSATPELPRARPQSKRAPARIPSSVKPPADES
jgi:GTP-binding protein